MPNGFSSSGWQRLIALARLHGLTPLLYRSLDYLEDNSLPAGLHAVLRRHYVVQTARDLLVLDELDWSEAGILGCDSVQNAVHRGKLFWAWGDTTLARYPLGIFHMTSATTAVRPLATFEPPLRLRSDLFRDARGGPRAVAKMPGRGPTWVSAYVALPDKRGTSRLVATYVKIKPPLEAYESGPCVWNDATASFERHKVLWTKSEATPKRPPVPDGRPVFWTDARGRRWALFGNPLPTLRCPATFEAWQDRSTWDPLAPQQSLASATDGKPVKPHSGSIAWNAFRKGWVTVFMQFFGKPSVFGELWYAEADSPTGPWGKAVKVLSHDNYTFYNQHASASSRRPLARLEKLLGRPLRPTKRGPEARAGRGGHAMA